MSDVDPRNITLAREKIAAARQLVVSTGAGVSAESGIPTFRGKDGLWNKYDPTELATPQAFAHDPDLVWEWYDWRRGLVLDAKPNPGHHALVEMERHARGFTLITQNVDGLHQRAGSQNVLEVHGSLFVLRCSATGCHYAKHRRQHPLPQPLPCPECGARLRPGVVWFGESLDPEALRCVSEALVDCDVFMVVGSSSRVYPAAGFANAARRAGAFTIEVNLDPTDASSAVDLALHGQSGEILPLLVSRDDG
jgi:NAD-dependent deacetylase